MQTQIAVIGAGPGGYTAAFLAADLGLKVILIDTNKAPGGVCLHRGCMPSKVLLHVAKILSDAKQAKELGIDFAAPKIELDKVRDFKNGVIRKLSRGLENFIKSRKITYIQGKACFLNSQTLKVETTNGTEEQISFEHAILATGSFSINLPFAPESPSVLNSTSALQLDDIPEKLLVVGGGYIGLEFATVYSALGSRVSIVEMTPSLLPGADQDLVAILKKTLQKEIHEIKLNTTITQMEDIQNGINVTFEDKEGQISSEKYNKVLVAVGRKPNTIHLGLEHTNVQVNDQGFVKVDPRRQTTDPKIFAIGDVTGPPLLAHKASAEATTAIETIAGKNAPFAPKAIPAVIYTDPEMAVCGLTETQAQEKNIPVKVTKFPWQASGRAVTLNRTDGLTKLITDPQTKKILGVGIVGVGAGELIAEGVVAVEQGLTLTDLKNCIHPHPTLSETISEAAESLFIR